MQDYLIRATAYEGKVRAFAVRTTGIVEELRRRHQTTPTATAALGRTATAALMMGIMLKGEEKLTVQVKGGGPIGQIVADSNAHGEVRGYVDNPAVDLPLNSIGKLDVAGAVGTDGFLYVIKDLGLKEPYRGSIPIVSGELGEDFTYYFAKSEQTPSAVALGVLVDVDYTVKTAGGFIIQLLPGLTDDEIAQIEKELAALPPITSLLDRGDRLEDILATLLPGAEVLERRDDIRFQCKCSRERVEQTLISLGRDELQQILEEDGKAEVVCHFCNEAYRFSREDLEAILKSI
ncbi:Hsp33 family molecular chaperone HslO [Paenibacillus oleatilyticus]|uniref:Hsp33 family molecular chaperone HslO n=1 Tax=Paenibacillus oleatilyticus TaxID=2594886 RepID=UPI001C1F8ADE|nr:Hsp33 family molecular chaperone HslO [Paenibacillus oleatilyticus]MBU7320912.1 Hsp33 family molecular chaperone HslO [Paenibacillus oleatilyticus]